MKNKKALISASEAAIMLGLPISRVRYLCRYVEEFPSFKIEGRYYINRKSAKKWVKNMAEQ